MDPIAIILFVGLAVIAVVMVYTRTATNIIAADNKCNDAWKAVELQLRERGELVAQLEEMMGTNHEALLALRDARAEVDAAMDAEKRPEDVMVVSDELTATLRQIFSVVERSTALMTNPDLVAHLSEIANAENRIGKARGEYNDRAREYNNMVTGFPGEKVAGFRYRPRKKLEPRESGDGERELPWAKF